MGSGDQILEIPGDRPIGELFTRDRGQKAWTKLGPAVGRIVLDAGKEYKLRLADTAFAPMEVVGFLAGLNCNLLAEIEAPLAVSESDLMDEALCGDRWLRRAIDSEKVKVKAALNTSARLTFTLEPIDFDALDE